MDLFMLEHSDLKYWNIGINFCKIFNKVEINFVKIDNYLLQNIGRQLLLVIRDNDFDHFDNSIKYSSKLSGFEINNK